MKPYSTAYFATLGVCFGLATFYTIFLAVAWVLS